jgi:hypothetical protein
VTIDLIVDRMGVTFTKSHRHCRAL